MMTGTHVRERPEAAVALPVLSRQDSERRAGEELKSVVDGSHSPDCEKDQDSSGYRKEQKLRVTSELEDFPWRWKAVALVMGIFLSAGSSFSESTLGPLKSTLIKQLGINNAQYGAISSATSLVNTILPFVGGCALDFYGVEWGSMVCSTFIFIGAVISASGTNADSFKLVLSGRIIMGIGSTVIETCTSKILAHWFQRRGLGLVYGIDIAFGKLVVLAARAAAVPMRDASAFWGWALWIPAIMCFVNLVQNMAYVVWVRSLPVSTRIPTGRNRRREAAERDSVGMEKPSIPIQDQTGLLPAAQRASSSGAFPDFRLVFHLPRFFWLVVCTQIMQAGVVGGFNGLSADIIRQTRGTTAQMAGYTSSMQQIIPVLLTPCLGAFFDFFGNRMLVVSATSALWIVVYALVGYTQVNALGVMIIASLALAFNALPFIASIPLMVPSQLELGLALGVWKAFNNCAGVMVDMIAGRLQDITPGQTYARVMAFFLAWKALEFVLGLFYGVLDRRYLAGILTKSEKARKRLEEREELQDVIGHKPAKWSTCIGVSVLASIIVIAWTLFFMFSL